MSEKWWKDGRMDEWMKGWMGGRMKGWVGRGRKDSRNEGRKGREGGRTGRDSELPSLGAVVGRVGTGHSARPGHLHRGS